jgi:hypothetical protein
MERSVIMEALFEPIINFIMTSSQSALCFLLQTASVLTGTVLFVRYLRQWRVWVPAIGICIVVLLTSQSITRYILMPFAEGLLKAVLWLSVFFLILGLPILLILRWIATGIISYFQQLSHRCNGCVYNRTGTCSQPSTCKGQ